MNLRKTNTKHSIGMKKSCFSSDGKYPFSKKLDTQYIRTSDKESFFSKWDKPDMWGSKVNFNIDGKQSFNTYLGCFVSFLAAALIISAFVYEVLKFVDNNPTIQFEESFSTKPVAFDSSANSFFVRVSFYHGNKLMPIEEIEQYFSAEIVSYTYNLTSGSKTQWDETPGFRTGDQSICSELTNMTNTSEIQGHFTYTDTGSDDLDDINSSWENYMLCTDPNRGFLANGSTLTSSSTYFSLDIFPCDINEANCFFGTGADLYHDIVIKVDVVTIYPLVSDYDNPIRYALREIISASMNIEMNKKFNVYFKGVGIATDYNRIYGWSSSSVNYQTYDYMTQDTIRRINNNESGEAIIQIQFKAGYKSDLITREYTKIADILSDMGGYIEIIISVLGLFYVWYNSINFEKEMLNKAILYKPDNINKKDFEKHYFTFGYLYKIYLKHLCCCCSKKKDIKELKLEVSRQKLEYDMNIVANNHVKHRAELLEKILIKPYQMKLIPIAIMMQLEHDQNKIDKKNNDMDLDKSNNDTSNNVNGKNFINTGKTAEELTQIEAADILVERMQNLDEMDHIEKSLNLWLISILDDEIVDKKILMQDDLVINHFDTNCMDKLDIQNFLIKNNGVFNDMQLDRLYNQQMTYNNQQMAYQQNWNQKSTIDCNDNQQMAYNNQQMTYQQNWNQKSTIDCNDNYGYPNGINQAQDINVGVQPEENYNEIMDEVHDDTPKRLRMSNQNTDQENVKWNEKYSGQELDYK